MKALFEYDRGCRFSRHLNLVLFGTYQPLLGVAVFCFQKGVGLAARSIRGALFAVKNVWFVPM